VPAAILLFTISEETKLQTVAATITEHPAVHCIGVIFRSIATGSWLIRLASATSSWFGSPAVWNTAHFDFRRYLLTAQFGGF